MNPLIGQSASIIAGLDKSQFDDRLLSALEALSRELGDVRIALQSPRFNETTKRFETVNPGTSTYQEITGYSQLHQENIYGIEIPPHDTARLYAKDKGGVSHLYYMDDAGVEWDLGGTLMQGVDSAGNIVTVTVTKRNNQVVLPIDDHRITNSLELMGSTLNDILLELRILNSTTKNVKEVEITQWK